MVWLVVCSAPVAADRGSKNKTCFGDKECVPAAQSGDCKVGSQTYGTKNSPWRGGNYINVAKACERFTNQWENVRAFEIFGSFKNPCPNGKFFLKGTKISYSCILQNIRTLESTYASLHDDHAIHAGTSMWFLTGLFVCASWGLMGVQSTMDAACLAKNPAPAGWTPADGCDQCVDACPGTEKDGFCSEGGVIVAPKNSDTDIVAEPVKSKSYFKQRDPTSSRFWLYLVFQWPTSAWTDGPQTCR